MVPVASFALCTLIQLVSTDPLHLAPARERSFKCRSDIRWAESVPWDYIVLDEGHVIRNSKSKTTQAGAAHLPAIAQSAIRERAGLTEEGHGV